MVTNEKKKYRNSYAKALAECETDIIKDFPNRVPFSYFGEQRNWTEIAKEMDIITERYGIEFPKFDIREKGWQWIYTRKDAKKRVWIE
jgi:hypothetical protein